MQAVTPHTLPLDAFTIQIGLLSVKLTDKAHTKTLAEMFAFGAATFFMVIEFIKLVASGVFRGLFGAAASRILYPTPPPWR